MTYLLKTNIAVLDPNLFDDINGKVGGWRLYEFAAGTPYDPSAGHYQLLWRESARSAGIVFVGPNASGHTRWMEARSPADAVRRYLESDDRCN